jgi:hypothetical protein
MTDPRKVGFITPKQGADGYSGSVNFNYLHSSGLDIPALADFSATSVSIVFEHCKTETGTFTPMYYDNDQISIEIKAVARREQLDPGKWAGLDWVRTQIVASNGTGVIQGAIRTFGIACRDYR